MNDDDPTTQSEDADDGLPPRLRRALAEVYETKVDVPRAVDAKILAGAKRDFSKRMRFRFSGRWLTGIGSVAAAVVILCIMHPVLWRTFFHAKGDINLNGKVDMLDAYLLAKRISGGEKQDAKFDMNGDGVVDQADVDWIANSAVQLPPGNGT